MALTRQKTDYWHQSTTSICMSKTVVLMTSSARAVKKGANLFLSVTSSKINKF